jgi:eukaryotic-like serine/threonine-protein kinase
MAMSNTTPSAACPRCGGPVRASAAGGLCRRCLARRLLDPTPPPKATYALERLGDYELLGEIARGGMGVVYRARQITLRRDVAVKLLRDGFLAGPAELARFRTEAMAAASLRHPNIVAIHEIGSAEGQAYFSMDLIEGRDLAALTREGPMPARQAAQLLVTIARAIAHAHDHGVLHRDLKPSNVLVDLDGVPHVTDFGLARRVGAEAHLTLTGQILGTPGYMAPEQAFGRPQDVGTAADIYSLGALFYHLLTGRAPFVGESPTAVLRQLEQREPVSPRLLNPAVPRDAETPCLKALKKEPSRRYASAGEFADDIERFLRGEPIHARPVSGGERLGRWARRRPAAATAIGVAALLVATVLLLINRANVRLEAQRAEAEQIQQFFVSFLGAPDPTHDGRDVLVVDLLARATRRAHAELTNQPLVKAELVHTLGLSYHRLTLHPEAEPLLNEALAIRVRELGTNHWLTLEARANLAEVQASLGRTNEARANLAAALEGLRKYWPDQASLWTRKRASRVASFEQQ